MVLKITERSDLGHNVSKGNLKYIQSKLNTFLYLDYKQHNRFYAKVLL